MSSVLLDLTSVILLSTRIAGGSTDIFIVILTMKISVGRVLLLRPCIPDAGSEQLP